MGKKNKTLYAIIAAVVVVAIAGIAFAAQGEFLEGRFRFRFFRPSPISSPLSAVVTPPASGVKPLSVMASSTYISRAQLAEAIGTTIIPEGVGLGTPSSDFSDISGIVAAPYIYWLADRGVMEGYPDGEFKPTGNVNRAEAALIFNRAFLVNKDITISRFYQQYKDVKPGVWYYDAIQEGSFYRILDIKGGAGANFYPSKLLSVGRAKYWIQNVKDNTSTTGWVTGQ